MKNQTLFYLVDIDGTIADLSHRLHFIQQKPADWDGFFAACPDDKPIEQVLHTLKILATYGAELIFVSGRSDAIRQQTMNWLSDQFLGSYQLYMRKAGDHRTDDVVKSELVDEVLKAFHIKESDISAAFEDRDQVVKMYRARGIRTFQVAEGNF